MRCLLVEDEPPRVAQIIAELEKLFGKGNVHIAVDRDDAIEEIDKFTFDLIVLDQRIPSRKGQLDPDIAHGRSVLSHVRQVAPCTPVYFLTGLPMEDAYIDHLIAQGTRCDVWGDRVPVPLNLRFQKNSLAPFFEAASQIAATVRITDEIEINKRGVEISLNESEMRLLRIFTRLQHGVVVDIETLDDGMSGARVVRGTVKDQNGGPRISAVGKLADFDKIATEMQNFEHEIIRLPAGSYAPQLPPQLPRVGKYGGTFYRLLDGYDRSLFTVLREDEGHAARCVPTIRESVKPWTNSKTVKKIRIGDFVRDLIWEDRLPGIYANLKGIDFEGLENREINSNICTRHGDLHGENALVSGNHSVMLIDYGAVGSLPSAIDAVTLELSPFFHPHGVDGALTWQSGDPVIDWFDLDAFCKLAKIPNYIRAARKWAVEESFGDREVLACAYAYVLRQLQFPKSRKDLAVALISGIVSRMKET